MNPYEIEPIYNYNFTTGAEDDDLTLEIPGYFKGEALVRELHYNGGEHAVYVRNPHQLLLCDFIHPGVRELLAGTVDIFISETDAKCEYMARVVRDDIDALAEEVLQVHDYRFPYHPFPIADGTLSIGEAKCEFCGETKHIYYVDRYEVDDITNEKRSRILCPHCIEENKAGDLFRELGKEYRLGGAGAFWRNLPFFYQGRPTSFWANHCYEPAIYLGQLEPEDLNPRLHEELLSTWKWLLNVWGDMDPAEVLGWFEQGKLNAHLFKCVKCGKKLVGFSPTEKSPWN
ncbi:MAG: CbrC family protein [Lachnospiraceae bacterium]|nr:CbrC family protein [Lachnospiraceae bacterium]